MDWIDKLNHWALKGIRRQAVERVETNSEGITLTRSNGGQLIRWSEMQELAAVKQPPLASGAFALVIRGPDSTLAIVDDTVPGYAELCEELPQQLPGVIPYEQWAVELTASTPAAGQVIFRRP